MIEKWLKTILAVVATVTCLYMVRHVWNSSSRWRRLRTIYRAPARDITLLGPWVAGTDTVRPGLDWQDQSDFECSAPCELGIAFCKRILFWRCSHFVIPWNDLDCSKRSRWVQKFDGCVVLHFEDPPEDLVIRATEQILQALREHDALK